MVPEERTFKTVNVRSTRVVVTPDRVVVHRPKVVGEDSTTVPMARITSVSVKTGLRSWKAKLVIAGDPDVEVEDLSSSDAKEIRDLIDRYRSQA